MASTAHRIEDDPSSAVPRGGPPIPDQRESDAVDRLLWAARSHAAAVLVVFVCVTLMAVVLTADDRRQHGFESSALVVNTEPQLRPAQLPRLGLAVFASSSVTTRLNERLDLPAETVLIPERVTVDPVPRSVVFRVTARTGDPSSAVRLVNAAAETFAEELNGLGGDLGKYTVQVRAVTPARPAEPSVSLTRALVVAVAVSVVVTVGLLSLLLRLRSPVLTPQDAVRLTGLPVIDWPGGRPSSASSRTVPGAAATTSGERSFGRLLSAAANRSGGSVVLMGDRSTLAPRRAIASMLSQRYPSIATGPAVTVDPDVTVGRPDRPRVVVLRRGTHEVAARRLLDGAPVGSVMGCLLLGQTRRGGRRLLPGFRRAASSRSRRE